VIRNQAETTNARVLMTHLPHPQALSLIVSMMLVFVLQMEH